MKGFAQLVAFPVSQVPCLSILKICLDILELLFLHFQYPCLAMTQLGYHSRRVCGYNCTQRIKLGEETSAIGVEKFVFSVWPMAGKDLDGLQESTQKEGKGGVGCV